MIEYRTSTLAKRDHKANDDEWDEWHVSGDRIQTARPAPRMVGGRIPLFATTTVCFGQARFAEHAGSNRNPASHARNPTT